MQQNNKLRYLVIGNAMAVLLIGLLSGVMLIFSLLDAVTLWPFPEWKVTIPGSTRGWQAAHVGGILNGVMIESSALFKRIFLALRFRQCNPNCSTVHES